MARQFKFEGLQVWQLSLAYVNAIYDATAKLPRDEEFNLKSQMRRAATSIALNIAEGSTGQTDDEQARFVGLAIRSLIETIACLRIATLRSMLDATTCDMLNDMAHALAAKLQAFRHALAPSKRWVREDSDEYKTSTID
jgi:four helix bundle protein